MPHRHARRREDESAGRPESNDRSPCEFRGAAAAFRYLLREGGIPSTKESRARRTMPPPTLRERLCLALILGSAFSRFAQGEL